MIERRAMTEKIDWDHFPEPYNRELPFYIAKAFQRLSPEGVEILNEVIEAAARSSAPEWDTDELTARMERLPEWDLNAIVAINKHFMEAFDASIEQARGEQDLFQQAAAIVVRAQELDPEFAARGNEVTLEEAVAVLKRHGVKPGISEEVMEVEVPRGDAEG